MNKQRLISNIKALNAIKARKPFLAKYVLPVKVYENIVQQIKHSNGRHSNETISYYIEECLILINGSTLEERNAYISDLMADFQAKEDNRLDGCTRFSVLKKGSVMENVHYTGQAQFMDKYIKLII